MLYKQIARRSCFSIFCVLALAKSSICQTPPSAEKIEAAMKMMDQIAAERFEQKARAQLARESRPKDRTQPASLESRLKQIDSQSACLKWFQEIQVISNIEDFSYKGIERDRLVKMLKTSESEVMELDAIFRERVEKHIKARQPFEASISVDRQRQTSIASEPVLTPDELLSKRSILEYARQERLSEFHALDRIVDVIDPRQFEVLVGHWGKRMMSIPISQKYLGLSPEQCEAVAKDEEAFERTKKEIVVGVKAQDALQKLRFSDSLFKAKYKPYSHLTPEQLLRSRLWLTEWRQCRSFDDRMKILSQDPVAFKDDERVWKAAELEILGDLYREGIEWEKTKATNTK